MLRQAFVLLLLTASPAHASDGADFDPAKVDIADAINCHLDAPSYNAFAWALSGEEKLAERFGWRKIESPNPFLAEYELPQPALVTGTWSTRRIAFSSSGVMALLDLADPARIAREEGIVNALDSDAAIAEIAMAAQAAGVATRDEVEAESPFRKFLGQRILVDVTKPANEPGGFGTHTVIARSISNVSSHPGKTLYGCSYRIELLDRDGKPL
ncbi:hypothetical protein [Novosphingobium sp.]|uniref:hypothetical protein n=1 Tax=Novosphingobium sp. TaxID=1874826 RepID=UPI0035AE109C